MKKILWIILAFAVIIRVFLFVCIEKSLWLDEAALALNVLDKSYLELFQPLQYAQSAPPLFLCLTKILVSIFGTGEKTFRLISLISSIGTVFVFYYLLKAIFYIEASENKKNTVLLFIFLAMHVFYTSFPLLYNTVEFKPYISDVLFTILIALIWFNNLQGYVTLKSQILFAIIMILFPLFSFGSIFSVCTILVLSILRKRKLFSLILILGLMIEYLLIFSKISTGTRVYEYWTPYFINYNPIKAIFILIDVMKYYFYPSSLILLGLIGFVAGSILLFKKKRNIFNFFFLTIVITITASFFNFYPFYERLSLFLYPIFLIIILTPLYYAIYEKKIGKKTIVYILSSIFILSSTLYNFTESNFYKREEIKPLLLKIRSDAKPSDKIFVFKGAHLTWKYYGINFDFKNDTFICSFSMSSADCADKIKTFCNEEKCFVIYASEVDTVQNVKILKRVVTELGGEALLEAKNSILYKI